MDGSRVPQRFDLVDGTPRDRDRERERETHAYMHLNMHACI